MPDFEVIAWIVANTISFIVSGRDLRKTYKAWQWAQANVRGDMRRVSKRNLRSAGFKHALATTFILAGVLAVMPIGSSFIVWLLVLGSILLTIDVVMESRYRNRIYKEALRESEREDHPDATP